MFFHGKVFGATALVAGLLAATPVLAQERGRTDGPEGSEYGKGGYSAASDGRVSLMLDWGASMSEADQDPPLFVGATGTYWMDDWFLLDASFAYLFNNERVNILVGPRFRTPGLYPIAFNLGLKAGAIILANDELRFGLSPQVGADFMLGRRDEILFGLNYAPDFALGTGGNSVNHRIFMSVGYRF